MDPHGGLVFVIVPNQIFDVVVDLIDIAVKLSAFISFPF